MNNPSLMRRYAANDISTQHFKPGMPGYGFLYIDLGDGGSGAWVIPGFAMAY